MNNLLKIQPSPERDAVLQSQIEEKQKIMDYEIREYPIEVIVNKFKQGLDNDLAELYIPDYQREFIWDDEQKSRFIESLVINIPIPYLFAADNKESARIEIIDGTQRIRTLVAFTDDEFEISNLKQLPALNGYRFSSLPKPMRLRLMRKTIRLIELSSRMDEEGRRELFSRLNSGGTPLREIEIRLGTQDGNFMKFIQNLTTNTLFKQLCPISKSKLDHREAEELILRFFAYLDNYKNFVKKVDDFLNEYLEEQNNAPVETYKTKEKEFLQLLDFINKTLPGIGFRKSIRDKSVPRIRFEALAIGTALALRENANLKPPIDIQTLMDSKELMYHTRSDASNSRTRVKSRLELVRDFMLGKSIAEYAPPIEKNTASIMQLGLSLQED